MAEQDVTQVAPDSEGSAANSNPEEHGDSQLGTADQTSEHYAPPASDPYSDLNARLAQIEQENEQLKRRYADSTREAQRLATERQQFEQQLRQAQQTQYAPQGAAQQPQTTSLKEAMDKYWGGDMTAIERYEQQQTQEKQQAAQQQQLQQLQQYAQTKNQQLTQALVNDFPALNDRTSEMYKHVYEEYDRTASDPWYQASQGIIPDPSVMTTAYDPLGYGGSKQVDMRVVRDLAARYQMGRERENGRVEESKRMLNPMLQPSSARTNSASANPGPLMTDSELEAINEFVKNGTAQRSGWGRTANEVIQKRWEKLMDPAEKEKRLSTWRAGSWDAKSYVPDGFGRR